MAFDLRQCFFVSFFLFLLFHWLHFLFGRRRRCNNKSIDGLTRQYIQTYVGAHCSEGGGRGMALCCSRLYMKNVLFINQKRDEKQSNSKTNNSKEKENNFLGSALNAPVTCTPHQTCVCVCVSVCGSVCKGLAHPGSEDQQQIVNRKYKNCENGALLFSLFLKLLSPSLRLFTAADDFVDAGDRKLCKLFSNNIKIKQEHTTATNFMHSEKKKYAK